MLKMERNGKIHCVEECQTGQILITNDKIIVIGGNEGTLEIIDIIDDSYRAFCSAERRCFYLW